jgi:hypothetical protein
MRLSLRLLDDHVARDPRLQHIKTYCACMAVPLDGRWAKYAAVADDFGFSILQLPLTWPRRVHDEFEDLLIHAYGLGLVKPDLARASCDDPAGQGGSFRGGD